MFVESSSQIRSTSPLNLKIAPKCDRHLHRTFHIFLVFISPIAFLQHFQESALSHKVFRMTSLNESSIGTAQDTQNAATAVSENLIEHPRGAEPGKPGRRDAFYFEQKNRLPDAADVTTSSARNSSMILAHLKRAAIATHARIIRALTWIMRCVPANSTVSHWRRSTTSISS